MFFLAVTVLSFPLKKVFILALRCESMVMSEFNLTEFFSRV